MTCTRLFIIHYYSQSKKNEKLFHKSNYCLKRALYDLGFTDLISYNQLAIQEFSRYPTSAVHNKFQSAPRLRPFSPSKPPPPYLGDDVIVGDGNDGDRRGCRHVAQPRHFERLLEVLKTRN